MPFYRFESLENNDLAPRLSTGKAPAIGGRCMYFCLLQKNAGTGSELHYPKASNKWREPAKRAVH